MTVLEPDMHSRIPGVILAGGLSRRMGGGDKPLTAIGGRTILSYTVERLRPQVGTVAINANGNPARFDSFELPVIADPVGRFAGPLAGILAGMEWAATAHPKAEWIVTAAGDTPFFPGDLVDRLFAAARNNAIALAASDGRIHPVFGLWPVRHRHDLRAFLTTGKTRKVLAWVDRHPRVDVMFSPRVTAGLTIDPFFNVNTPEDLKAARAFAAAVRDVPA